MFDALARRTVFSKLDNESINLVLEFHGNTFFGLDPILLTWYNMSELRMYKPYIQDFSVSRCLSFLLPSHTIKLHIRVDVDTMRFLMDNRKEVNIHADERHEHVPIQGSVKVKDMSGKWRTMRMSAWAGGYTKTFCNRILDGALKFLTKSQTRGFHAAFPTENLPEPLGEPIAFGQGLAEEQMMHPAVDEEREDDRKLNWSENEIPEDKRDGILTRVSKEIRRSVRRAHRGLGHPSRRTFTKMLRLGRASPPALLYAQTWICPTCAASARPAEPHHASTRTRPFGFNVVVVADLKYLKSLTQQLVALSLVCAGTSWHVAALLRNRKPRHVFKKILTEWIAHYGCPELLVLDQGGEFAGRFKELADEFGIDIRVTGAHAP